MTSGVTVQIFAATAGTYMKIIEIWPTIEGSCGTTCAMEQLQQTSLVTGRISEKIDVIS
jgi:hypothetical protein